MAEEYDDEYPEATPAQKRQIASYFVLSSPVGEVKDVLTDVRVLVNDSAALDDGSVAGMMREYNVKTYAVAKLPDEERQVLVTPYGQVSETRYVDPASGSVYEFSHEKREFTAATDQRVVVPDKVEAYRAAVQEAVRAYAKTYYVEGKCVEAVYGSDDGKITVCLSATNTRLRSFWTGGMQCTYSLSVGAPGTVDVDGSIKINVHYFEDGNVQLNNEYKHTDRVEVSDDPAATAKALVASIEKSETDFQRHLEEMYITLHTNTFKAMRRVLPINRQKFNWDATVHSLASQVAGQE